MALSTAPTPISALRGPERVVGHGRGNRTKILLDVNDALEPCLEGQATAAEAEVAFERIINAAIAGQRHAVVNLAQTGQYRARQARAEFARMAAAIDVPDDAA